MKFNAVSLTERVCLNLYSERRSFRLSVIFSKSGGVIVLLSKYTPVILYSKELLDTENKIQNSGFNENTEN